MANICRRQTIVCAHVRSTGGQTPWTQQHQVDYCFHKNYMLTSKCVRRRTKNGPLYGLYRISSFHESVSCNITFLYNGHVFQAFADQKSMSSPLFSKLYNLIRLSFLLLLSYFFLNNYIFFFPSAYNQLFTALSPFAEPRGVFLTVPCSQQSSVREVQD